MKKNIKHAVWLRIAAATCSSLAFCAIVNIGIAGIRNAEAKRESAEIILKNAQDAELAHYKWSGLLSNAIYEGVAFTGSTDPTTCTLGQWIYGDAGSDDAQLLALRSELEPLHKQIHESAKHALALLETDPDAAQTYYHTTIRQNVDTLVDKLGAVIARVQELNKESVKHMDTAILGMQILVILCFLLSLVCLLSLAHYVLRNIVHPILTIIKESAPLNEGHLHLELSYHAENEIGQLVDTLGSALEKIDHYVSDINRVMGGMATSMWMYLFRLSVISSPSKRPLRK